MTTTNDILTNLQNCVFYHGTWLRNAERIFREGFRVWYFDEDGDRVAGGGNLGIGIYVTCNWRIALWFGTTLLRVAFIPGTRILNSALPPDRRILEYLKREFGRDILRKSPWKVIPKNKKLKLDELISLFRYHYWETWERDYKSTDGISLKWPKKREQHCQLLKNFRSLLIRHGFHGFGNPKDDNGIVMFAGDRVKLLELVTEIPGKYLTEDWLDSLDTKSLSEMRKIFRTRGSVRAVKLAEQIAAANEGRPRRNENPGYR